MYLITFLLVILVATFIIYFSWNYISSKQNPNRNDIDDIRYYELKSKYEFLVAAVALFGIGLTYFGVTTQNAVKEELNKEMNLAIQKSRDSMNNITNSLKLLKNDIETQNQYYQDSKSDYDKILKAMLVKQNSIETSFNSSKSRIKSLRDDIKKISESNALKKQFYIIEDLTLSAAEFETKSLKHIKFSDLRTVKGERLPAFDSPPFILISSKNGGTILAFNISKTGFDAPMGAYVQMGNNPNPIFHFQLIIYN